VTLEQYVYRRLANAAAVWALIGEPGSPNQARIFPQVAPAEAALPVVVYQAAGGDPLADLQATAVDVTRLQLACRAASSDGARALANAVRLALDSLDETVDGWGRVTGRVVSRVDLYDDAPRSYARVVDVLFLHP
jgi:hypothetical protein